MFKEELRACLALIFPRCNVFLVVSHVRLRTEVASLACRSNLRT